jgi:hypothetical protein
MPEQSGTLRTFMDTQKKYITFKQSDWQEHKPFNWQLEEINDAVVLRRQDFLAAPLLQLYAETLKMTQKILIESGEIEAAQALEPSLIYFLEQASKARKEARKLPD